MPVEVINDPQLLNVPPGTLPAAHRLHLLDERLDLLNLGVMAVSRIGTRRGHFADAWTAVQNSKNADLAKVHKSAFERLSSRGLRASEIACNSLIIGSAAAVIAVGAWPLALPSVPAVVARSRVLRAQRLVDQKVSDRQLQILFDYLESEVEDGDPFRIEQGSLDDDPSIGSGKLALYTVPELARTMEVAARLAELREQQRSLAITRQEAYARQHRMTSRFRHDLSLGAAGGAAMGAVAMLAFGVVPVIAALPAAYAAYQEFRSTKDARRAEGACQSSIAIAREEQRRAVDGELIRFGPIAGSAIAVENAWVVQLDPNGPIVREQMKAFLESEIRSTERQLAAISPLGTVVRHHFDPEAEVDAAAVDCVIARAHLDLIETGELTPLSEHRLRSLPTAGGRTGLDDGGAALIASVQAANVPRPGSGIDRAA